MKVDDAWEEYRDFSGRASEISRQLAFAAIAIIWLFRIDSSGDPKIRPDLGWAAVGAVLTLLFDILQYVVAAVMWRVFARGKEKEILPGESFDIPHVIPTTGELFFALKILALVATYAILLISLGRKLF